MTYRAAIFISWPFIGWAPAIGAGFLAPEAFLALGALWLFSWVLVPFVLWDSI